ncbi:hypothetical protein H4R34_003940 [Dimargaris verticillata]|uniref:Uncharacterized protein n=1 Tax=Dimargaris verticillata TaxID=2761393 RepID=A0A9W8B594_9FUNG|nr:hypothetical protein H4R34_003940 [Dimargaris verticillata]
MHSTVIEEELRALKSEEAWFLEQEVTAALDEIKVHIQLALLALGESLQGQEFESSAGSTLALSSPSNESIKGFVSIFGSQINKGELRIVLPRHLKAKTYDIKIDPDHPIILAQIQDTVNFLHMALELLATECLPASVIQAQEYIQDLLACLRKAEAFFALPLTNTIQYPMNIPDPTLPENIVLELFINRTNFVAKVHVLESGGNLQRSHSHPPFSGQLPIATGTVPSPPAPRIIHQVSVDTVYPYLETAQDAMAKAGHLTMDVSKKLRVFATTDAELYELHHVTRPAGPALHHSV